MAPKKLLSLQDVLNACLESDNEGSDLGVDSNDSLNEDSSEKINLLQLILSFDEKQAVFSVPTTNIVATQQSRLCTRSCNSYSFFCS